MLRYWIPGTWRDFAFFNKKKIINNVLAKSVISHTLKYHVSSTQQCHNLLKCTIILGTIENRCKANSEKVHNSIMGCIPTAHVLKGGGRKCIGESNYAVFRFQPQTGAVLSHSVNFLHSDIWKEGTSLQTYSKHSHSKT